MRQALHGRSRKLFLTSSHYKAVGELQYIGVSGLAKADLSPHAIAPFIIALINSFMVMIKIDTFGCLF